MRFGIVWGILFCFVIQSAPIPKAKPIEELSPQALDDFSRLVAEAFNNLTNTMYYKLDDDQLLLAAVSALYATSKLPIPESLGEEIKTAMSPVNKDYNTVYNTLKNHRMKVGKTWELEDYGDLKVAVKGMLARMDPSCRWGSYEESSTDDSKLGFSVAPKIRPFLITRVIPGSPAQNAGLRPGDQLTHLNGSSLLSTPTANLLAGLAGVTIDNVAPPKKLDLTLHRMGRSELIKTALRRYDYQEEMVFGVSRTQDDDWNYWLDRDKKIALVRLGELKLHISESVESVIQNLVTGGMKGLILDLRATPRGYIDEVVNIASLFLEKETPIITINKKTFNVALTEEKKVEKGSPFPKFPLVVLINRNTGGSGEMVAAALQDQKRAELVGERTAGRGSMLGEMMIIRGVPLLVMVPVGEILRPNGKPLRRAYGVSEKEVWGVQPEPQNEIKLTADLTQKIQADWGSINIRPYSDTEAYEIDDPRKDPLLQVGLKRLLGLLKAE